jgi:hypothetical protein
MMMVDITVGDVINDVLSQAIDEFGDGSILVLPPRKMEGEIPPNSGKVLIAGSPEAGYRIIRTDHA